MAEKLKAQLQDLGKKNPALKAMERAAREQASNPANSAAAQKQLDDRQKSPGKAGQDPAALDKVAEQMQKLEKAAAGIPRDNSPEAAAERQKMAQSLSDLADKARALGQPLPNLDDAIAALQANQTENFQKDMDLATTDLEKAQQMSKELQRMQQQADRDGKDLPEQLKFGQPELAQQSLQKMIDKLRSGKLSADEAAKILDEVSRAVEPAVPYGDASHYLHQAAQQMRNGDKAGSAAVPGRRGQGTGENPGANGRRQGHARFAGRLEQGGNVPGHAHAAGASAPTAAIAAVVAWRPDIVWAWAKARADAAWAPGRMTIRSCIRKMSGLWDNTRH